MLPIYTISCVISLVGHVAYIYNIMHHIVTVLHDRSWCWSTHHYVHNVSFRFISFHFVHIHFILWCIMHVVSLLRFVETKVGLTGMVLNRACVIILSRLGPSFNNHAFLAISDPILSNLFIISFRFCIPLWEGPSMYGSSCSFSSVWTILGILQGDCH